MPASFDEAIALFEEELVREGRSDSTVQSYASTLRDFGRFYRDALGKPGPYVSRLDETDVRGFVDHLSRERHLKTTSINRAISALRRFSRIAVAKRWHRRDVAAGMRVFRPAPPSEPTVLKDSEVRRLIAGSHIGGRNQSRNLAILQFLLQTGIRVGELCSLTVGDVVLHKTSGRVSIRAPKVRAERVVPLNAPARQALARYLHERGSPGNGEPLFLSERQRPMSIGSVQYLVKKCLWAAGRSELSTHDLRHHFAGKLYEKTKKLTAVQQTLGHRNLATSARYAQTSMQEIEAALEDLNEPES